MVSHNQGLMLVSLLVLDNLNGASCCLSWSRTSQGASCNSLCESKQ
ncbi:hypothetical protein GLYMA_09G026550v4 [Glycine max]|nr:hypothetical protein GLYMA_09G026550v4 [Glycine max]KAH1041205.1 hypothetical protein GYH30_023837 [Glycine max]